MITPRTTRLLRVPDLHAFRSTVPALAGSATVVVVPTRSAARQLARAVDACIVTRDELYDRMQARLANPGRRLAPVERDVIAQAAARAAASAHPDLAFRLRPGLVAEILRFYDQLRRQSQHVDRFEELLSEALGGDDFDRAAARLRVQTAFLAAAFRGYERRARASGACDEHMVRERLIAEPAVDPIRHVAVTVADWIAEADGLYAADFDLLTRVAGLERLDIVCTERVLGSGFHERLHTWWPGLEESTVRRQSPFAQPMLTTPDADRLWFTRRDREEELVAVARQVHEAIEHGDGVPAEQTAIVYKNPLPYLYAAAGVLGAAGLSYQSADALPLAAEPAAASLDLVFDAVASNFTRATLVTLMRSPRFTFGERVTRESISALDRFLSDSRYLGDPERLPGLGRVGTYAQDPHGPALEAAAAIARELAPLSGKRVASLQIRTLLAFWESHLTPVADDDPFAPRERRARAAITGLLTLVANVHADHDDPDWTIADLTLAARRWIGEHTFAPDDEGRGLHLVDDRAARYGEFDDITIVGLTDADWPERPRRNIFYPPSLLRSLGWPSEKDRRAAADARFLDLVGAARRRTTISTITLEDDALVTRSMQLDEIPRARLSSAARPATAPSRVFADEALSLDPVQLDRVSTAARPWAEMRIRRTPPDAPAYHGSVGAAPPRPWSVSAVETYLDCPFKFFAQHVLKLEEEPDDEEVMDPRSQGRFVHQVFETFFQEWHDAGGRAITPRHLDAARELFATIVDRALESLPDAEGALERTRLLGSPAAAGLGEAVFRMEAERPTAVVERLLEERLDGPLTLATANGPRTVTLRGKADRVDLLADGTFRVVDYKLGWPPNRARALQLPIYGLCAEQRLASHRGRRWTLGEAAYLAFKGPRRVVPLFTSAEDRDKVLAEAQQRLADTLDKIAAGEFPPTPDDPWRCETCSFASVCRKDYVGDV